MEENEHLLELISHVTEDSLGIEDNKKHKNITEQTLKDCITLETINKDNSKDNLVEAIISEIIIELVGSVPERTLELSELATTPLLSNPRTYQLKPASEVTDVLQVTLTPRQSIPETVAEGISNSDTQKEANTMAEDGKAEPEHNEISSDVAKDGKINEDTEDNNLKDGTQTGGKEDIGWY
jgi:hypothetical protein